MQVYLSHLGEAAFQGLREFETKSNSLRAILTELESTHPGTLRVLCDGEKGNWRLKPHVSVYTDVKLSADGEAIYDSEDTRELKTEHMDQDLSNVDSILISVFDPERFKDRLVELMWSDNVGSFSYFDENGKKYEKEFQSYFSGKIMGPIPEAIYPFRDGEATLASLATDGAIHFVRNEVAADDFTVFDRRASQVLPRNLVKSLQELWDLDSASARLRRFQEDCLFFILGKLREPDALKCEALLLSIPTGGGKTEAFTIPLVAHVADLKRLGETEPRIKAIITYPTKALANDQARRLLEIIRGVNAEIHDPAEMITLGVLTGDTPKYYNRHEMIVNLCPRCHEATLEFIPDPAQPKVGRIAVCQSCNEKLRYFRVTKKDILESPPDILITNPDMINYCLQDTQYHRLFEQKLDIMVFDEIHLCDGIFGCNVAHLLRRMEEAAGDTKPFYVGISATISNAETLASLIFDIDSENIRYLNDLDRFVDRSAPPMRYRYHYCAVPKQYSSGIQDRIRYMRVLTSVLNVVDMLGHAVRDPHFRKTLVFANFRQDADHIAQYLLDQEDHFFHRYHESVHAKMMSTKQMDKIEAVIAAQVGHWYEKIKADGHLHSGKLEVGWHRGGLEQEERLRAVSRFVLTRPVTVDYDVETPIDAMVATKTLELGIDIGDVTTVINSSAPHTKNEYVQRVGRAGRRKSSVALTVIDPNYPLDYYFYNRFPDMITKPGGFEDAPIIITNRSIRESHLLARIVDLWARRVVTADGRLSIKRIKAFELRDRNNRLVTLKDTEPYTRALLDELFLKPIYLDDGTSITRLERLNRWFAKESKLLGVQSFTLTAEEVYTLIRDKIAEIWHKTQQNVYKDEDVVNGFAAVDTQLTPSMRGVGTMVDLYIAQGSGKPVRKDSISRTRAISSMPPHSFSTMGANTFTIRSIYEPDSDAQRRLFKMLAEYPESRKYFHDQFGDDFPLMGDNLAGEIVIRVPKDYLVEYRPNRFYCPRCGRTYRELPSDGRCDAPECGAEVRQLTQFYQCQKCGELYDPPIPRVCPNPSCIAGKPGFIREFSRKGGKPKYADYFQFKALPGLHWRCRHCNTTFNYHDPSAFSTYKGRNLWEYLNSVPFSSDDSANPDNIAKRYLHRPESKFSRPDLYLKQFHPARWKCSRAECRGKIVVRNVPVVRSDVAEYIAKTGVLAQPIHSPLVDVDFSTVLIAALAKEYYYRFYDPAKEESSTREPQEIFGPRDFLGNIYATHAAFVTFGHNLDEFLTRIDCWDRQTGELKCENCPYTARVIAPVSTRPTPRPSDHDLDQRTQTPRHPAPWGKWEFGGEKADAHEFLRFVLIHTLKHGLLMGMPKYAGVSTSELGGRVYPNGERKHDLVILDSKEDGSGSIYLVRSNWNQIWSLSREMVNQALQGEGSLFLEYGCHHRNQNLCPALASWFYDYVEEAKDPPIVP